MSQSSGGILPALVTPFHASGALNSQALESLLERIYMCGSQGVYVCGQTGEGLLMPPDVREQTTDVVIRNSPKDAQVIVHVGASCTDDAIRIARHAEKAGVSAISSLPPIGPYSFEDIRNYYVELASSVNLPLLVYYFPEVSPAIRSLDQILSLCEIPGVIGLKFTDFDLYRLNQIRNQGHIVFNGRDEVLVAGLLMGANGGIGTFYNLLPRTFVEIQKFAQQGDWALARLLQDEVNRLIALTLRYPVFPAVKRMLEWSGIPVGNCIRPRTQLSDQQWMQLQIELKKAGFTPDDFKRGIAQG